MTFWSTEKDQLNISPIRFLFESEPCGSRGIEIIRYFSKSDDLHRVFARVLFFAKIFAREFLQDYTEFFLTEMSIERIIKLLLFIRS